MISPVGTIRTRAGRRRQALRQGELPRSRDGFRGSTRGGGGVGARKGAALAVLVASTLGLTTGFAAAAAPLLEPDIVAYKVVGDNQLTAHVFKPEGTGGARSAIVILHGGGWTTGEPSWAYGAARRFVGLGMVAIAGQYRLSGASRPGVTPLEAMADARSLFRWVREHHAELGIDPRRIVGYGWSAGAHLVASAAIWSGEETGVSCAPDAMILSSPAISLHEDRWLKEILRGRAAPADVSPDSHVRPGLPPTLILQGRDDTVTPLRATERFHRAMLAAQNESELIVFDGVGHLFTPSSRPDSGWPEPDPEVSRQAKAKMQEFLRVRGFLDRAPRRAEAEHLIIEWADGVPTEAVEAAKDEGARFYALVAGALGHGPPSKVTILLNGDPERADGSRGYPRVDGFGRIHLYQFTPDVSSYFSALAHEMVHVFRITRPNKDWFFEEAFAEFVALKIDPSLDGFPWFGFPVDLVAGQWIAAGEDIPLTTLQERHKQLNLTCKAQSYALRASFFLWLAQTYGEGAVYAMATQERAGERSQYRQFFGDDLDALASKWRADALEAFRAIDDGESRADAYRDSPIKYMTVCKEGDQF